MRPKANDQFLEYLERQDPAEQLERWRKGGGGSLPEFCEWLIIDHSLNCGDPLLARFLRVAAPIVPAIVTSLKEGKKGGDGVEAVVDVGNAAGTALAHAIAAIQICLHGSHAPKRIEETVRAFIATRVALGLGAEKGTTFDNLFPALLAVASGASVLAVEPDIKVDTDDISDPPH